MELIDAPPKTILPFAADGGKNVIPVASQIGITNGAASFTDGFPPLTRTPVAAGGIPPFGLDMNGILNQISAIVQWANAGAGYIFDGTWATNGDVGGYPQGARVLRSDGAGYWLNTADSNTTDPETSGAAAAGWVPDLTNGISAVTMTNANVTLNELQYGKPIIVISGTLTANVQLIFPAIAQQWIVINNTTGAFTITCKTAGGTGTTVTGNQIVICDGTNVIDITGAAGGLLAANNLSDVASAPTSLLNLGIAQLEGGITHARNIAWASNTTINIAAASVMMKNASGQTVKAVNPSVTLNSASSGANGIDAGSIAASTLYYIWGIYNPTTSTFASLLSLSATAPTLPSGYTYSALLSSAYTDGSSHFIGFTHLGIQWEYLVGSNLSGLPSIVSGSQGSTSVPTYVAASTSAVVPSDAMTVKYVVQCRGNVLFAPNGNYGALLSLTNPPPVSVENVGGQGETFMQEYVRQSSNAYYASDGSASNDSGVFVAGFTLNI